MNEAKEIVTKDGISCKRDRLCIGDCCIGGDYDITLKLFSDKSSETPECSHHMRGSGRHSLCKLLAVGGIIAASVAALVCVTHIFCSWVCRVR